MGDLRYLNRDLPDAMVSRYATEQDKLERSHAKLQDRLTRFYAGDFDLYGDAEWKQQLRWEEQLGELVEQQVEASRKFEADATKWRADQIERAARREEKQARKLFEELKARFG